VWWNGRLRKWGRAGAANARCGHIALLALVAINARDGRRQAWWACMLCGVRHSERPCPRRCAGGGDWCAGCGAVRLKGYWRLSDRDVAARLESLDPNPLEAL